VCVTHGAKRKLCKIDGCTYNAVKGGVCVTHGAKRKLCEIDGCTNNVVKGGVCVLVEHVQDMSRTSPPDVHLSFNSCQLIISYGHQVTLTILVPCPVAVLNFES